MSENSSPAAPRRSGREKKATDRFAIVDETLTKSRKRKHVDTDDESLAQVNGHATGDEDEDPNEADDDAEGSEDGDDEDERPKKSKKKTKGPPTKKPRNAATATRKPAKPRVPKDPATTKSKKRATGASNEPFDPTALTKVTNISSDNPLFNAILNPNAALQGTVEDFLESLQQNENQALAELVNMILRCCACNETVDGDTAVDHDGVVDRLDDIAEELKKTTSPAGTYPLISKTSPFHNAKAKYSFRANLSEFISRLVNSSAALGSLYDSQLMETLQVWLVPMSSSQIRSIRHTTTVIALQVEAALCEVAKEVEKEIELAGRMKEGEKKRARTKGTAGGTPKGKEKELETKLRESKKRQATLVQLIKEVIDGVFIHRYRDLDPVIRAECITSLSTYFEILPSHFCADSNYLRYVGWVLSDPDAHVRSAAVKALQVVYQGAGAGSGAKKKKGDGVVLPALRHFTTRFLPRLLEIARYDVDVHVRVAVMNVLGFVDELALLPEEDRNHLGTLVFSDDKSVRKGVSRFVNGVWEEWVEERMGEVEAQPPAGASGRKRGKAKSAASEAQNSDVDQDKVGIKGLAFWLVRWGRALDRERRKNAADEDDEEEEEDGEDRDGLTTGETDAGAGTAVEARGIAPSLFNPFTKKKETSRESLAVEALWDEMDVVKDWEGILDMLVLDHSASEENDTSNNRVRSARAAAKKSKNRKKKGKQSNGDVNGHEGSDEEDEDDNASTSTRVDPSWRLTEAEEGVLLEVLMSSLALTKKQDDSLSETITQALIKALPRLFIKYQTDEKRIINVLTLPMLMNLEVYLEMRETSAYVSLWSDIAKQFLTHTSAYVIATAASTIIMQLLPNTALANVNSEQMLALEDELATSLRDAVAGPEAPPSSPSRSADVSPAQPSRDIEICHLTEDEVLTLSAVVFRLRTLAHHRDMTHWMEETEGGKRSSVWDILCAISERARLSVGGEGEMIERCLEILGVHMIWKKRHIIRNPDSTSPAEEEKYREDLITQRDALLEKLVEYAVGTQVQGNGIVEGVKRVAFITLMNTYIVFFDASPKDTEDHSPSIAITMDDEVQWRCAGFVQAEVERYAEKFLNSSDDADSDTDDDDDESDNEGGDAVSKKANKANKKTSADTEVDFSSRYVLEQEYLFIEAIAALLRALESGVLQVRHGAVLFAHYGRLGPGYDYCVKRALDLIKGEAENNQLIVLVISQGMKEAFNILKKSHTKDETDLVALAKLLSSLIVVRGGQLAILHRLDAEHIVEIHTSLINWIVKQMGSRASSSSKDHKVALLFFRALIPLVSNVQSRDALRIKAHLDQAWVQAKIEPGTTKLWEPLRAYEKRLSTAMSKDKPAGTKGRGGRKKKDGGVSTDGEESEVERLVGDENTLSNDNAAPVPPRPKPRPHRAAASRAKAKASAAERSDSEMEQEEGGAPPEPSTPKSRPRPKAVYKSKASVSPDKSAAAAPQDDPETPASNNKRTRVENHEGDDEGQDNTPRPSRKRARRDSEDEEEDSERRDQEQESMRPDSAVPEESASQLNGDDDDLPPLPIPPDDREGTPAAEVQTRRKRIRH